MKIPFDIKYKPQIESGEYKVCDQSGNSARIICWDAINTECPDHCIIALIKENVNRADESNRWYNTKGYSVIGASRLFIITPEPELTEFEQELVNFFNERNATLPDKDGVYNKHDCDELLHKTANKLLALAKKELLGQWNEDMKNEYARGKLDGITVGYNDAMKKYNESVSYHYPIHQPPCFCEGICTKRDCIDCPNQSSGTAINTLGTNKVE